MPLTTTRPATQPSREASGRLSHEARSELTASLLDRAAHCADAEERMELLDQVVLVNRRIAESIARRYRGRGISDDDLQQTAYEGLTKAVQRFEGGEGRDLLSYAVPTIRGELRRHFRDHGWAVRPPRRVQELQAQVNKTIEVIAQQTGRDPEPAEVIEQLEITPAEYDEAVLAFGCFRPASLDQPVASETAVTVGDLIPDLETHEAATQARVRLAPVVRRLPERDRRILYLRFFEDRTQEEIGQDLGVTQMQVSRLLTRILGQLRDQVA